MNQNSWADGPLTGLANSAAGNSISRTEDLSPHRRNQDIQRRSVNNENQSRGRNLIKPSNADVKAKRR